MPRANAPLRLEGSTRREAGAFLETVEFTAVDFLADEPERDAEIHARFGPQVAELVRRDRQQNVRRAFRSFPLHELPLAARTINPFALYEAHLAGGRIALLPFILARARLGRAVLARSQHLSGSSTRSSIRRSTASRSFRRTPTGPPCARFTVCASLSSWDRSGCGLVSTWNTWGCRCPRAPPGIAGESLMEADLDYIGATRQDRIIAEQVPPPASEAAGMGRAVARSIRLDLRRAARLPGPRDSLTWPIAAARRCGPWWPRASSTTTTSPRWPSRSRASSAVMAHAADGSRGPEKLAARAARPGRQPAHALAPGASDASGAGRRPVRASVLSGLRPGRAAANPPLSAPASPGRPGLDQGRPGPGERDPWATVKTRMRDVLLRTDLWSDQILVLRAVQSLTMLDLQHNCELVWNLGGYTRGDQDQAGFDRFAGPPRSGATSPEKTAVGSR